MSELNKSFHDHTSLRFGGLRACGMWCFILNSNPGLQIVFHCKIKCTVPLKWQFQEFFLSVAAAFLCVALRRFRETSERGVRWSQGSSLNFELKLRHSASEKISCIVCVGINGVRSRREVVIAFIHFLEWIYLKIINL